MNTTQIIDLECLKCNESFDFVQPQEDFEIDWGRNSKNIMFYSDFDQVEILRIVCPHCRNSSHVYKAGEKTLTSYGKLPSISFNAHVGNLKKNTELTLKIMGNLSNVKVALGDNNKL